MYIHADTKTIYIYIYMCVCINIFFKLLPTLELIPANIYLLKANIRNTRKSYEICSKLTIKTPERRP